MGAELPHLDLRCTSCAEIVTVCAVCRLGFLPEHVVRCWRENGHAHEACVPRRATSPSVDTIPPNSGQRKRRDEK